MKRTITFLTMLIVIAAVAFAGKAPVKAKEITKPIRKDGSTEGRKCGSTKVRKYGGAEVRLLKKSLGQGFFCAVVRAWGRCRALCG